jgi:IS5 family transposase
MGGAGKPARMGCRMSSGFEQWVLREKYSNLRGLGDRLVFMKEQIDWEPFVPLVRCVFNDNDVTGGRPHTDELVVVRAMLLQSWYDLSDEELEFQCNDRLSFQHFLGFPEKIPDFTTVWKIRERLIRSGQDKKIWTELQRQLDRKGYRTKKGVIQDATFIEAGQGKKRIQQEKKAKQEGKQIEYTEKQKAHMDKDGTFAVKGQNVHFGYKDHIKMDVEHQLIRSIITTTASRHDNTVDLVEKADGIAYRDRGYFGTSLPTSVLDKTMQRATRGRKLNGGQQRRNNAISRIRSMGERPFSVIKRTFRGDRTNVKTLQRVSIKEMLKAFAYDLYQLVTLDRKRLANAIEV